MVFTPEEFPFWRSGIMGIQNLWFRVRVQVWRAGGNSASQGQAAQWGNRSVYSALAESLIMVTF